MRNGVTVQQHHDYWNRFYSGSPRVAVPGDPSPFARWVLRRLRPRQPVVEFGFGNGRDSLFFAGNDHQVYGYDFAESAVSIAQRRADDNGLAATFHVLDLYDSAATRRLPSAPSNGDGARESHAVYARFLIHSLEEPGRANLFDHVARSLGSGGELYLEFRTCDDRDEPHLFGDDHFRTYLDVDEVADEILQRGGSIVHRETGRGLAVYKSEDPHIGRIVARFAADRAPSPSDT